MSLTTPVIDELARALGVEIAPELREALIRIEIGERAAPLAVVTSRATDAPSKAALRTRKWRARKAGTATIGEMTPSPSVTGDVTKPSRVTSPTVTGDALSQKESFPLEPPSKKNTYPKPLSRRRQRHAVTFAPPSEPVDRTQPDRRGRLWLHSGDPVYLEIRAHRPSGMIATDGAGGWRFSPAEIAAAEARLGSKVTAIPVRGASAGEQRETRPPRQVRSG